MSYKPASATRPWLLESSLQPVEEGDRFIPWVEILVTGSGFLGIVPDIQAQAEFSASGKQIIWQPLRTCEASDLTYNACFTGKAICVQLLNLD